MAKLQRKIDGQSQIAHGHPIQIIDGLLNDGDYGKTNRDLFLLSGIENPGSKQRNRNPKS